MMDSQAYYEIYLSAMDFRNTTKLMHLPLNDWNPRKDKAIKWIRHAVSSALFWVYLLLPCWLAEGSWLNGKWNCCQ